MVEEIGKTLKQLRREKDLTLEEVARLTGIAYQNISRYENGGTKNIPMDKLILLSDFYGVSPQYILGWADDGTVTYTPAHERREPSFKEKVAEHREAKQTTPEVHADKNLSTAIRVITTMEAKELTLLKVFIDGLLAGK